MLVYSVYNKLCPGIFFKIAFAVYDHWNNLLFIDFNTLGFYNFQAISLIQEIFAMGNISKIWVCIM